MTSNTVSLADQRRRQVEHDTAREEHHRERESLLGPIRSREELKALAEDASVRLADATTDEVLTWVAKEFGYRTAVACSMADAVLPDVVAQHLPWVDTLFLDTGYHFAETIGTRDAVESTMQLSIVDVTPQRTVAEQDAEFGKDLFARDPGLCCQMRKVEPLAATLEGYEVWITGVRREDSWLRANTPLIDWDEKNGMVKVNPLAAWTFDELIEYASEHDIVINPLMNDGYPSIGCAPCTQRVAPGDDPRAGRWAGLDKTECGLHT
jgi:phosphoadenosine phosphosulfate reductase